jgi:2-polyprenyl-3-methyl-5-hydroxy-6-metoxy-1,4-benzoquinol methylase
MNQNMAARQIRSMQNFSRNASRYECVIPDYQQHPDKYSRTCILLDWVGTGKRVLELGCATGYMSQYMTEKRNCSVTGVEIDKAAGGRAAKFCREVFVRDLNLQNWATGLPKAGFDVVLMGDVLEHLVDSRELLVQVRELLDPDGTVVICVPNVVHWITRLKVLFGRFDYEPAGTLDHTHLRFYTVRTARQLIESAGYRITRFHPAFGGRLGGHVRPVWRLLAHWFPGLFAFQLLYEARAETQESTQNL